MTCLADGTTTGETRTVDGAAFPLPYSLVPGEGYWFYAYQECDLLLPGS